MDFNEHTLLVILVTLLSAVIIISVIILIIVLVMARRLLQKAHQIADKSNESLDNIKELVKTPSAVSLAWYLFRKGAQAKRKIKKNK